MQVSAINNYGITTPRALKDTEAQTPKVQNNTVNFTAHENNKKDSKAMRNAVVALCFLPVAGGLTSSLSSCDDDAFAYARAEVIGNDTIRLPFDSTDYRHPTDTIIKWYYKFQRPIPLDTLFKNMDNWDIPGSDGDMNDSTSKRNIIHYEGTREWEYNTKEIGDINLLESSKNILVYDTEIKDYKGNHESYGKRVLRVPSGSYTIKTLDGKTLRNPGGLFVEEYENETGEKNGSIYDCKLKSRAFVQTNGDTLNVSKRKGTSEYVETGKAAKGYLASNSILLRNLIGEYSTDDHYVDFSVEAINDEDLRLKYIKEMDETEGK